MSDHVSVSPNASDPMEIAKIVTKISGQSQRLMLGYLERYREDPLLGLSDMSHLGKAFSEAMWRQWANPAQLFQTQMGWWQDGVGLWQNTLSALWGGREKADKPSSDRRFKHDDWHTNPLFDSLKQFYLVAASRILKTVREIEGADAQTAKKVDFYTRQFVDALAPTNFVLTNPEVLRTTVETGGRNLLEGLSNLLDDLERGKGQLVIKMTDLDAFELGKNIATTAGKVVYQNELMQLIQYEPTTERVHKRPLLIVPPWINKYYILDLQPTNSFVKWAVDQGHTVFVISWVNPDKDLAQKCFEDYMLEGPLAALDAVCEATGEKSVNAVGYCLGGTLLTTTLAYLASKRDTRIKSATCFATMLDFAQPGELEVFIDEDQISVLEKRMAKDGYLDGSGMATTFNMLRANDLIWSFFVNNYLLGKEPFPFDLLYWNSDSTRMPARMHSFYLRNMYQHNRLREPGGIELAGKAIDLSKIKTPMYFLSTVEDHIAPWQSTYAGPHLVSGPVRFVLGGSGHIAGVINPPAKNKYYYHTNTDLPADPEAWFRGAERHEGSWWGDWHQWVSQFVGPQVSARAPGNGKLAVIEEAPGSYVKVHLHD